MLRLRKCRKQSNKKPRSEILGTQKLKKNRRREVTGVAVLTIKRTMQISQISGFFVAIWTANQTLADIKNFIHDGYMNKTIPSGSTKHNV